MAKKAINIFFYLLVARKQHTLPPAYANKVQLKGTMHSYRVSQKKYPPFGSYIGEFVG